MSPKDPSPTPWDWVELSRDLLPGGAGEAEGSAKDRHEAELEAAFSRGYAEGEETGSRTARAELQTAVQATEEATATIQAEHDLWAAHHKEWLVALSTAIARKLLDREMTLDPAISTELVVAALEDFPPDQTVRIRVHPDDLEAIRSDLSEQGAGPADTRWIGDPDIARGGCLVEGPDQIIDGRVDRALERIYQRLTDD